MTQEIVLSAGSRHGIGYWTDLWRARELLFFLAWRDILVRYKQAVLGVLWAVFKPLLTTLVFALVFGKIARLPAGDIPYLLLVLSGIAPWFYFAYSVGEGGNSLVSNSALITKVYFPRLVIPVTSVLVNLIDLGISLLLLCAMLTYYGIALSFSLLIIPAALTVLITLTMGVGLWVAALNAKYRDVQFVLPFLITFGLYLSPIGFSSAVVPDEWRWLFNLNPIVGVIDGFRWGLFGDRYPFQWWSLVYSFGISVALVLSGVAYFRSIEREIVDVL